MWEQLDLFDQRATDNDNHSNEHYSVYYAYRVSAQRINQTIELVQINQKKYLSKGQLVETNQHELLVIERRVLAKELVKIAPDIVLKVQIKEQLLEEYLLLTIAQSCQQIDELFNS
ncbi:hypothetical protein AB0Y21_07300 [Weissella paramesenteroides]|uniref:hypothetical protein n=1 Tax=Weissella paramesenteroides TaxID=1249 RepID=UPI003F285BA0